MHEILTGVNMGIDCELRSLQLDEVVQFHFTYSLCTAVQDKTWVTLNPGVA